MRVTYRELETVYSYVRGEYNLPIQTIVRLARPMPERRVRLVLKHLVAKGHLAVRKRDGVKHLPWQKQVPIRYNVYTAVA